MKSEHPLHDGFIWSFILISISQPRTFFFFTPAFPLTHSGVGVIS